MLQPVSSSADSETPVELLSGERLVLVKLILAEVEKLPGTADQKALRLAFVEHRFAFELVAWRIRRNTFRKVFVGITLGTAALGATSSGLVAASRNSKSTAVELILVMIGVAVAVSSAVNSFLNPGQLTSAYKNDEFELRRLGWEYLGRLEDENADRVLAFNEFREAASKVLERQHGGWSGAAPPTPPTGAA